MSLRMENLITALFKVAASNKTGDRPDIASWIAEYVSDLWRESHIALINRLHGSVRSLPVPPGDRVPRASGSVGRPLAYTDDVPTLNDFDTGAVGADRRESVGVTSVGDEKLSLERLLKPILCSTEGARTLVDLQSAADVSVVGRMPPTNGKPEQTIRSRARPFELPYLQKVLSETSPIYAAKPPSGAVDVAQFPSYEVSTRSGVFDHIIASDSGAGTECGVQNAPLHQSMMAHGLASTYASVSMSNGDLETGVSAAGKKYGFQQLLQPIFGSEQNDRTGFAGDNPDSPRGIPAVWSPAGQGAGRRNVLETDGILDKHVRQTMLPARQGNASVVNPNPMPSMASLPLPLPPYGSAVDVEAAPGATMSPDIMPPARGAARQMAMPVQPGLDTKEPAFMHVNGGVQMNGRRVGQMASASQVRQASLPMSGQSRVNLRSAPLYTGTRIPQ